MNKFKNFIINFCSKIYSLLIIIELKLLNIHSKNKKIKFYYNHSLGFGDSFTYYISKYSEIKKKHPEITTLEEILTSIGHKTNINIEIKNQNKNSLYVAEKVIQTLKQLNLIDNIIISSFNPWIVRHIKKIDDRFVTAWIWGKDNYRCFLSWRIVLNYFKVNAIHINHKQITGSLIKKLQINQIKVLAYTVNNSDTLLSLISKNIDGVFTDSPSILELSRNTNHQNYLPK